MIVLNPKRLTLGLYGGLGAFLLLRRENLYERGGEGDDALNILKFAVGLTDGPSADWVFVDGDADYSEVDRKNTNYDEGILISDMMTDMSINMTGILVGDVDGSYLG